MIIKKILLIVFLFPIGLLYAQTDFRPGYVITNSNDTLYGEIDYRGDLLMGQVCKFRTNTHEIIEYTPYDIAAYRFPNNKYFVSKEVAGKKVFLEFLIKGQANIYYMRDETGDYYFIDKDNVPLIEIPYWEGIREIEGRRYFYATETHLGILYQYMQDAPDIHMQIKQMKKPEHKTLIKLAENYHNAVCTDGSSCIVFEKKQPFTKVAMDVVGGKMYYKNEGSSFIGGILLNFWMPRVNENIYFRTGLSYSQYEDINGYFNTKQIRSLYNIPLMLEYIYPKSIIRPKAAFGTALYYNQGLAIIGTCMGGFNIMLGSSIGFSFEYNLNFYPDSPLLHSFLGGFHFRF